MQHIQFWESYTYMYFESHSKFSDNIGSVYELGANHIDQKFRQAFQIHVCDSQNWMYRFPFELHMKFSYNKNIDGVMMLLNSIASYATLETLHGLSVHPSVRPLIRLLVRHYVIYKII